MQDIAARTTRWSSRSGADANLKASPFCSTATKTLSKRFLILSEANCKAVPRLLSAASTTSSSSLSASAA
eukprot:scaffold923_cov256-Pinguiococcus_pyrenoidosus.AAC.37